MSFLLPFLLAMQAPPPLPQNTGPSKADQEEARKWLELSPSQRIRKRNLFHPLRGTLPASTASTALQDVKWPTLAGTQLGKGLLGALLKWPGTTDAKFLGQGETYGGFQLKSVKRDRVTLVELESRTTRDLELNLGGAEGQSRTSDLEQVLRPAPVGKEFKGKP